MERQRAAWRCAALVGLAAVLVSCGAGLCWGVCPGFPKITSAKVLPNRAFQLTVESGCPFRIEASTNFVNWVTLTNVLNPPPVFVFTDTTATNFAQRYYRAAQQ